MTLLRFKTILHKKCRSDKNSEGPAENSWVLDLCPAKWKQISKSLHMTHIFFQLKICPIFFKFWMLTCIWCFWYVVFEYLIKTKGKEKVKWKCSTKKNVLTNLWIWTHILVLDRQLTSNLYFFNYLDVG